MTALIISGFPDDCTDDMSVKWLLTREISSRKIKQEYLAKRGKFSQASMNRMVQGSRIPVDVTEVYRIGKALDYIDDSEEMKLLVSAFFCDWMRKIGLVENGKTLADE